MRFSPLFVVRYFCVLIVGTLLVAVLPTSAQVSSTNVFNVKDRLQASGMGASGVQIGIFKGNSGVLLGTNSSDVEAIAVLDTGCTPTGIHPHIQLVTYNRNVKKITGVLIDFGPGTIVYSADDQITMNTHGVGGSAAEGANVDALITYRYQPCTSTNSPSSPVSVNIQPLGTFKPTGTPAFQAPITSDTGAIIFQTEDPNNPELFVNLTGIATEPSTTCNVDLNVGTLSFENVAVGTNSVQTLTVRNNGTLPCTVSSITLNGGAAFTFTGPAVPFTLMPATAVNLPVTFTPVDGGDDSAVLRVTSTDPTTPQQYVNLSGTGTTTTPCDINASPLLLPFGSVDIGSSKTLSVTLTNDGEQDCIVDLLTLVTQSSNFTVSAPAVPFIVGSATAQVVSVTYTPTDNSSATGTLEIDNNDSDNRLVLVSLTGTGSTPDCNLAIGPTSLDFGAVILGNSRALSVAITNVGLAMCTINSNAFAGSSEFALNPPITTPVSLLPGDTTNFVFVYTPATNGTAAGSVTLQVGSPAQPDTVITFSGMGVGISPNCTFVLSRTVLSFGDVAVGTADVQKFQISNTSATNCNVQSLQLSGSANFTLIAPPLPINLASGETVEVGVSYLPPAVGEDIGQLEVITDDQNQPITDIPLDGNGVQAVLAVSTNALNFGALPVGVQMTQSVFLTNTNTVDCTITSIATTGSGDFILDPIVPTSQFILKPAATVEIAVIYLPSNQGTDTGTVNVNGNQVGSPTTIQLTGVGLQCNLSVAPASLPFGTIQLNTTNTMTVTINNTGNTNCTVDSIQILGSGRYFVTNPDAPFDVPAGQPVSVTVDYLPANIQTLMILGGAVKSSGNPTIVTP